MIMEVFPTDWSPRKTSLYLARGASEEVGRLEAGAFCDSAICSERERVRDGRCGALFGLMTPAESRSESRTGGDALLLFRETLCGGLSTWFSQSFSYLCGWKKNTLFQVQYRVYLLLFETTAPQQALVPFSSCCCRSARSLPETTAPVTRSHKARRANAIRNLLELGFS